MSIAFRKKNLPSLLTTWKEIANYMLQLFHELQNKGKYTLISTLRLVAFTFLTEEREQLTYTQVVLPF